MKSPVPLSVDALVDDPAQSRRPLVDARSPSEFAEDHLPGAMNLPVLDDAERARVGTLHREHGSFAANRDGAALVSRRIAAMLEGPLAGAPKDWSPIVYCWRGGSRSWSLATVLARIGWRVSLLEGGYRGFRQRVVADTARIAPQLRLFVLAGPTGVGKTRLLQLAARAGHQVLDLEALANHRGSVLGAQVDATRPDAGAPASDPGLAAAPPRTQPSQKAFESRLWRALRAFDAARPVLVESESRKIGRVHLPEPVIVAMRGSPCLRIDAAVPTRIALLRDEYRHFEHDPAPLLVQLDRLVALYPDGRVRGWRDRIACGDWDGFVAALLLQHYDPAYFRSMQRNYAGIEAAPLIEIADAGDDALADAAERIGRFVDQAPDAVMAAPAPAARA